MQLRLRWGVNPFKVGDRIEALPVASAVASAARRNPPPGTEGVVTDISSRFCVVRFGDADFRTYWHEHIRPANVINMLTKIELP